MAFDLDDLERALEEMEPRRPVVLSRPIEQITPGDAEPIRTFVRERLSSRPGRFGHFVVDAMRAGIPLAICGPAKGMESDSTVEWQSYANYLDLFTAYAAFFRDRMVDPYRMIPAFPRRDLSFVDSLEKGSEEDVVLALVNATTKPGRALSSFRAPSKRKTKNAPAGSRSTDPKKALRDVPPAQRRLTTLSLGAGRDSITLALILASHDDPWLVKNFPQAAREASRYRHPHPWLDLLATYSNTGSEYDFSLEASAKLARWLRDEARHPFDVVVIEKPVDPRTGRRLTPREIMETTRADESCTDDEVGETTRSRQWWSHAIPGETAFDAAKRGKYHLRPPLWAEHVLSGTHTARDSSTCTMNQKIEVMRRFRQDLCAERFGIVEVWRKNGQQKTWKPWVDAIRQGQVARHRTLIGINADEPKRTDLRDGGRWPSRIVDLGTCTWDEGEKGHYTPNRKYQGACYADAVEEFHYPLVDWGIGEAEEAKILDHYGFGEVRKSGCLHCHWASRSWFWANLKRYPDAFEEAVAMEVGNLLRRFVDQERVFETLQGISWKPWQAVRKRLGETLWEKSREYAAARRMDPVEFLRAVASSRVSFVRPTTLMSSRGAILPCEVAYHEIHHPEFSIDQVLDRAYRRGGGAA